MTDAITQRDIAHAAFAQFIADSSDAIHESYWFSIRGECESSLCMHSMLTMDEFCRLLYIADLVQIGKRGAQLSRNIWAQFLIEMNNYSLMAMWKDPKPRLKRDKWN